MNRELDHIVEVTLAKPTPARIAAAEKAATFRRMKAGSAYGWLPYGASEWQVAHRLKNAGLITHERLTEKLNVYIITAAGEAWLAKHGSRRG